MRHGSFDSSDGTERHMKRILFAIALLVGLGVPTAYAQTVTLVEVVSTSDDSVGQRLVFAIKEGIRASRSMELTVEDRPRIRIDIVTLDPDRGDRGMSTVYSIVWTFDGPTQALPSYLTTSVGTCGASRVRDCADGLVADTDRQIEKLERLVGLVPPAPTPTPARRGSKF